MNSAKVNIMETKTPELDVACRCAMSHVRVIHLLGAWHGVDCATTSERFGSCRDCDINARSNFSGLHEFIGLHGTRSMESGELR